MVNGSPTTKEPKKPVVSRAPSRKDAQIQQPNVAAVFGVFFVCIGVSVFVLIAPSLKNNRLAEVIAGVMMALAVSVVLFSIVPSTAPVRVAIGLGGAALFYFMLWPQIEKAIHPPSSTAVIRGSIYFINENHDLGLRPVEGAEVRVPGTSLKAAQRTSETGDFTIFDVPAETKDLDVYYNHQVYPLDLSKFPGTVRYLIVPSSSSDDHSTSKLHESYVVDSTLEINGSYWERTVIPKQDVYISTPAGNSNVRQRICPQPESDYVIDDGRPDFHGGLRISNLGGNGYHSATWDGSCYLLYADGRDGNSAAWAKGVEVAVKRLVQGVCGRVESLGTKLVYSGVNQIALDTRAALGPCVGSDLPKPLIWKTAVVFRRANGSQVESVHFEGFDQQQALNKSADLWMNTSGLLSIVLRQD